MSNVTDEGALTLEDYLVCFSNVQKENFSSLLEILKEHSKRLQAIENLLTNSNDQTDKASASEEVGREAVFKVKVEEEVGKDPVQVKMETQLVTPEVTSAPNQVDKPASEAAFDETPEKSDARSLGKTFFS